MRQTTKSYASAGIWPGMAFRCDGPQADDYVYYIGPCIPTFKDGSDRVVTSKRHGGEIRHTLRIGLIRAPEYDIDPQ